MSRIISYGNGQQLTLDLPDEQFVADVGNAPSTPLSDPGAALLAAVTDPLDFPPLSSAVVPGDRVAIAVDTQLPRVVDLVAGVVHVLVSAGAQIPDITVLYSTADGRDQQLVQRYPELQHLVHDPDDHEQMCYLAASESGRPVYFNRALTDADVVVPLGVLCPSQALGYAGINSGLYPAFTDAATQHRFRRAAAGFGDQQQFQEVAPSARLEWSAEREVRAQELSATLNQLRQQSCQEADEATWLLGVLFSVQVVRGGGDEVLQVIAGDQRAVTLEGERLCQQVWSPEVPGRAAMVIASMTDHATTTWDQVARAIHASLPLVEDDGTLVICSSQLPAPGPALARLAGSQEHELTADQLMESASQDNLAAVALSYARERCRVYLVGQTGADDFADSDTITIAAADEIERLAQTHASCTLVANADQTVPHIKFPA